ncbi:hypothetical protein E2562_015699 [Oryza meyeriana var. granulata]|uniref:Uncharacterized protein n=1 Tax=Oryza meyeriana var. granulata TaxID=110450 RepID=A0A6G1D496_9ORYZ|nr:hypothetical protein E2562_015699 [Oryza meyeriana var. granulata]
MASKITVISLVLAALLACAAMSSAARSLQETASPLAEANKKLVTALKFNVPELPEIPGVPGFDEPGLPEIPGVPGLP